MCAHVPSEQLPLIEDGMRLMRQCPLCQTDYQYDKLHHIEEDAGAHLVHVTCMTCSTHLLAIIMMTGFGMSSVGMVTDLGAGDVRRLQSASPLTADDILNMYEALHTKHAVERHLAQTVR